MNFPLPGFQEDSFLILIEEKGHVGEPIAEFVGALWSGPTQQIFEALARHGLRLENSHLAILSEQLKRRKSSSTKRKAGFMNSTKCPKVSKMI